MGSFQVIETSVKILFNKYIVYSHMIYTLHTEIYMVHVSVNLELTVQIRSYMLKNFYIIWWNIWEKNSDRKQYIKNEESIQ